MKNELGKEDLIFNETAISTLMKYSSFSSLSIIPLLPGQGSWIDWLYMSLHSDFPKILVSVRDWPFLDWRLETVSGLNCMHTATSERPGAVPFLVILP